MKSILLSVLILGLSGCNIKQPSSPRELVAGSEYIEVCIKGVVYYNNGLHGGIAPAFDAASGAVRRCQINESGITP